jgi:predicted transposase/invertase (TIGR01784 family)
MYTQEELERNTILEDEKQMARDEGHQEGFEVGRQDGIKQGIKEVAKKLKNEKVDIHLISKVTNLPIEIIEQL